MRAGESEGGTEGEKLILRCIEGSKGGGRCSVARTEQMGRGKEMGGLKEKKGIRATAQRDNNKE